MTVQQGVFKLKGVVQNYSWGGYQYIPELVKTPNTDEKPFAEYWLGAHPNHPARMGADLLLTDMISRNKKGMLGESVATRFGSLPYLLKVLDVRQMLSIQVHP